MLCMSQYTQFLELYVRQLKSKKKHAIDEAISTLTLCNELITLTNEKTQPFKPNIGK